MGWASWFFCWLSGLSDRQGLCDVGSVWDYSFHFPPGFQFAAVLGTPSSAAGISCSVCQLLPPTRAGGCTWVPSCRVKLSCQWTVPPGAVPHLAFQELLASGFHLLDGWPCGSRSFSTKYISMALLFPTALPTSWHSSQSWLSPSLWLALHSLLMRCSEVIACK